MKKLICLTISILLILGTLSTALAVDATYKDGRLTVSTGDEGFFEIYVDGVFVGKWVGTGLPSNTFPYELEPGEHRVRIFDYEQGTGSNTTFTVEGEKQTKPKAEEQNTGKEEDPAKEHTHTPAAIPAEEPTCGKEGKSLGLKCEVCGEVLVPQTDVPALSHRYAVIQHSGSNVTYQCMLCGDTIQKGANESVNNRYGNIILEEKGMPANYRAAADKSDGRIIVLTLDKTALQAELTLENSLIMQIIREGYTAVRVVNGKTVLTIDLYKVSPSWFSVSGKIESYLFTVNTDAELTVQALSNGERVETNTYSGVTVQ